MINAKAHTIYLQYNSNRSFGYSFKSTHNGTWFLIKSIYGRKAKVS